MNATLLSRSLAIALACLSTSAFAAKPIGYGAGTTGGGDKTPIKVATLAAAQAAIDSYSGSGGLVLLYTGVFDYAQITDVCAQWKKPAQKLVIKDKSDITVKGANGSSANFGVHIVSDAKNIIVQNMTIGLLPGGEDSDAIGVEGDSSGKPNKIWIDHNTIFSSLTHCPGAGDASWDGAIDHKRGAYDITISYNYIHDHQKVTLNGHSDDDDTNASMRATYHHNRYENVESRLPLQRLGRTHLYNNYYNNVITSGINVRMGGLSLIESNYFENVKNPVTSRDSDAIGYWELRDNFVGSGITWDDPGSSGVNATDWKTTKAYGPTGYTYKLTPAAKVKAKVIANAGAGQKRLN
ncbi:polysaccharide lyase family 1 protein [Ideonella sp. DXS29W]|uniref:Polysaccharide lyase family 1 protein n=1 Tax=Ideonella lacteola TaxID=2984193 RepID=A0ABU9BT42_9BURK